MLITKGLGAIDMEYVPVPVPVCEPQMTAHEVREVGDSEDDE